MRCHSGRRAAAGGELAALTILLLLLLHLELSDLLAESLVELARLLRVDGLEDLKVLLIVLHDHLLALRVGRSVSLHLRENKLLEDAEMGRMVVLGLRGDRESLHEGGDLHHLSLRAFALLGLRVDPEPSDESWLVELEDGFVEFGLIDEGRLPEESFALNGFLQTSADVPSLAGSVRANGFDLILGSLVELAELVIVKVAHGFVVLVEDVPGKA